jgi:tRNA-uridine 2-sulfurtransferase
MNTPLNENGLNSLGLPKAPKDTRVVVAMSGGVDSSVVAALLHAQGYDVLGITLQLYDHGAAIHRKGACCAGQDIYDAQVVAERLGIPHYVLDYETRFRAKVIDDFAMSYARGETPIPCVACNQHIKFNDLFETALELGADILATGHYVASRALGGARALYRAADPDRDQSYFLFATTPEQLKLLRFPLGDMTKPEVRELARTYGLAIADKADSQDICFVPSGKYTQIIERLKPEAVQPGDIIHINGEILGQHQGIIHYTIGQRRGLGIASSDPLYVLRLDAAKAQVIVGPRALLATKSLILRDINWLGDGALSAIAPEGLEIFVKVRSTRAPVAALLHVDEDIVRIELLEGEDGVSPGQACVFYQTLETQSRVLGGGFIQSTQMEHEFKGSVSVHPAYVSA